MPTKQALHKALYKAGSSTALAEHFGISQQAVHKWFERGVPPARWADIINYIKE
jgi:hypothetical protein